MQTKSERMIFEGATGEELAARLDRPPEGPRRGYALFAHCFTCSKDVMAASRISKVLAAAGEIDEVRGVATIGAPFEPEHVRHLFGGQIERISTEGEAEVTLAGRTFRITEQFLDDLTDHQLADKIRDLRKPLLLFHSPVDDVVGIENAGRIFEAAQHPKSFVSLDDADHLLSEPDDAEYVASVLAAWASRYLGSDSPQ